MLAKVNRLVNSQPGTSSFILLSGLPPLPSFCAIIRAFLPTIQRLFYFQVALVILSNFICNIKIDGTVIFFYNFWNLRVQMFIEPAEYLDLTDRLAIITSKYQRVCSQKAKINKENITLHQQVKLLSSRIAELQKQKEEDRRQLKQHVTVKTDSVLAHITVTKQSQKVFVSNEINKLKNWSAIQTLKQLEERINENRTVTFQKQFYEKVKTLFIIKNKKAGCTSVQLFQWIKEIVELKKATDNESFLGGLNNGTQKSITNKSMNKSKVSKKKLQQSQVSAMKEDKENIPVKPSIPNKNNLKGQSIIPQTPQNSREPIKVTIKIDQPGAQIDPLSDLV